MNDDEEEMIGPSVYDIGDGVRLEIPIADGIGIFMDMADEEAQQLVNIIQNKINARL